MSSSNPLRGKLMILLVFILFLPVAIAVQVLRIQIIDGRDFRSLWSEQTLDELPIKAERGQIIDRKGRLLATNFVETKVAIDPKAPGMTPSLVDSVAFTLAQYTQTSASEYIQKIRSTTASPRYVVLERSAPVMAVYHFRSLNLRGIILEESYKRRYPFNALSAHLLGFVNHNGFGMTGLEKTYDAMLRGTDGAQQVRRNRNGEITAYVGAPQRLPEHGVTLETTIDGNIQAIVEEEIRRGMERWSAKGVTAIIMNPKTGEIVAMANVPTFNPNAPAASPTPSRRNRAIADMIEPGSTFKLVTAIAAVEQRKVRFDEIFDTPEDGRQLVYGQMLRDHDPLGTLSFTEVFSKSSNIATAEIAMRVEPRDFYQYARALGYGSPTHIDLPNEMPGRLQKPYEWSKVTLPWMSIGYEVQATPLQVLQSYAAFANGGEMMKPFVVKRSLDWNGKVINETTPTRIRQVAQPETIQKLLPVFEDVLADSGTAEQAAIEGLQIAGKTGTAQKYTNGGYGTSNYYASFAGFFPSRDPMYAMMILVDEPRGVIYGGWTAGTIFRHIAERIRGVDRALDKVPFIPQEDTLRRQVFEGALAITPDFVGQTREEAELFLRDLDLSFEIGGKGDRILRQEPVAGQRMDLDQPMKLWVGTMNPSEVALEVPELRGLSMKQATNTLIASGFEVQKVGSGTIYAQFPLPGERLRTGYAVTIRGKTRDLGTSIQSDRSSAMIQTVGGLP